MSMTSRSLSDNRIPMFASGHCPHHSLIRSSVISTPFHGTNGHLSLGLSGMTLIPWAKYRNACSSTAANLLSVELTETRRRPGALAPGLSHPSRALRERVATHAGCSLRQRCVAELRPELLPQVLSLRRQNVEHVVEARVVALDTETDAAPPAMQSLSIEHLLDPLSRQAQGSHHRLGEAQPLTGHVVRLVDLARIPCLRVTHQEPHRKTDGSALCLTGF